jgi:Immunity protein 40
MGPFGGLLTLIPEQYRRVEKKKGRALTEIGTAGVAFTREGILEALDCLKGSQVAVLGGDVLEVVSGKPRYTSDSWYVNREAEEDLTAYLERSITEAEQYVRRFPDPDDGTILYSPTLSELGL